MATVRFSIELINRIKANANSKMQLAVTKATDTKLDNSWGQRIYDILFPEVKPIISQVPATWLKMVENIEISKVAGRACNMKFTFATPQPWPYVFPFGELAVKESTYGDYIVLRSDPVWDEFLAEVVAYNERVSVARQRQNEFVNMVLKVCDAYSTLAPALKAWPPLWDLIPEDVKNKHREVKERTKNDVVLDVDFGKLTALSTAAKFGI